MEFVNKYGANLNLMGMMNKTIRNDAIKNPLDIISTVLGRSDFKKQIGTYSKFISEIKSYDPGLGGITASGIKIPKIKTKSITTALLPDMSNLIHIGGSLTFVL